MSTLIDLFRESTLVQAMIALLYSAGVLYLVATGQNVPEWAVQILMLIIGFYFGSKVQQAIKGG